MFHDVLSKRPHDLATITPEKVQGFTLLGGDLGTVGSKICWHYTHGMESIFKFLILALSSLAVFLVFPLFI